MNHKHNNNNQMDDDDETAALLAELRAISMQSASASRFRSDDDDDIRPEGVEAMNDDNDPQPLDDNNNNHNNKNSDIPNDILIPTSRNTLSTNTATSTEGPPPPLASLRLPTVSRSDTMTTSRNTNHQDDGDTNHTMTTHLSHVTPTAMTTSGNSSHRSTSTPPLTGSPTKKNSIHLNILQRHSPQVLRRKSNSSSPIPPSSPGLALVPSAMTEDTGNNTLSDDHHHEDLTTNHYSSPGPPPEVPSLSNHHSASRGRIQDLSHHQQHNSNRSIRSAPSDERSLSPMKQKVTKPVPPPPPNNTNDDDDAMAPTTTATTDSSSIHPTTTTTKVQRNGGSAEDAELLALLRGISNASSSASRFASHNESVDNDDDGPANHSNTDTNETKVSMEPTLTTTTDHVLAAEPPPPPPPISSLPPWKRRNPRTTTTLKANMKVADPHHEEANSHNHIDNDDVVIVVPVRSSQLDEHVVVRTKSPSVPSNNNISRNSNHDELNISSPEPPPPPPKNNHQSTNTILPSSSSSFTFQGERGGAAEDEELLALLRGISSASSSSNRFDDDNDTNNIDPGVMEMTSQPSKPTMTTTKPVPPWKKRNNNTTSKPNIVLPKVREEQETLDVPPLPHSTLEPPSLPEIEQPPQPPPTAHSSPPLSQAIGGSGGGIPSGNASKPYQGERGGVAEDAELLALLRGVSSSVPDRFSSDTDSDAMEMTVPPPKPTTTTKPMVPPWKKRSNTNNSTTSKSSTLLPKVRDQPETKDVPTLQLSVPEQSPLPEMDQPSAAQSSSLSSQMGSGGGIASEIVSKPYQGERGGVAEDAELLALLRGVSSSVKDRFSNDMDVDDNVVVDYKKNITNRATEAKTMNDSVVTSQPPVPIPTKSSLPPPTVNSETATSEPSELNDRIATDDIPTAVCDKNWKVRCQAYDTLSYLLREQVEKSKREENSSIDSDVILPGLDDRIHTFVEDANAGALDKALEFSLSFADHCTGAGKADIARRIVSSMIQKNCFSSRPTTLKLSNVLTLKLMEVGVDGNTSVHAIIETLLTEGLASKKPKVIQASASLILDATYHFGATSLPLATVTNTAPKMLSHSNALVRDCCIKVLAEICRTLGGSKAPIQNVVDGMKKAQLSDLDAQLSEQPEPTPIRTGLRSQRQAQQQSGAAKSSVSAADAMAALQANAKELEAQRFAARSAVDIIAAIAKTDYAEQILLSKWSEKVAALDKVLECGGEKPYKLMPPSSHVNYGPLITEMKKLLAHTHFVVCSRAIQVLAMLAQGVGEKLYPHLRPTLAPLLQLSKDKKLTTEVSNGLDALFGTVLSFDSLLESDDAVPSMVNEKIQKNALARATALSYLQRCVDRQISAGPKGVLSASAATAIATLMCNKLDDSDASVRKVALIVLESLLRPSKEADKSIVSNVQKVIEQLRVSNARAYKSLTVTATPIETTECTPSSGGISAPKPVPVEKTTVQVPLPTRSRSAAPTKRPPSPAAVKPPEIRSVPSTEAVPYVTASPASDDRSTMPRLEEAMIHITSLAIPLWDATEDDGGILAGLKASKWQLRHDAIEQLRSFIESGGLERASPDVVLSISCILLVVREQTRGFRETNVNIMKAILNLCIAICEFNESKENLLPIWAMKEMASICVQKISDRKLLSACQQLLSAAAVVSLPFSVLQSAFVELKNVKSPVAHEELLKWFQSFCNDFGAPSIGRGISDLIPYLLEELGSLNAKVKRETISCFAILHRQIGPALKALVLSLVKQQPVKDQLQKCFEENPFDPSLSTTKWTRSSIMGRISTRDGVVEPDVALEIPTLDLMGALPADILTKLATKEGKTAWKMRKEALDEIDEALKNCSGLLATGPVQMKQLIELARGLKDRLTDLQINLRPSAARIVGTLVSLVDSMNQAKLCKVVLSTLINEAMNDIKKPMRDASLLAIRCAVSCPQVDGGNINVLAIEPLLNALVSEVNDAAIRAGGLPDVLTLFLAVVEGLPTSDGVTLLRGQPVGDRYAAVLIECLTSSKSETRSAALSLLEGSLEVGVIGTENIKKATDRLKPALQRSVGPLIAKIAKKNQPTKATEENEGSKSITDRDRNQSHPKRLDVRPISNKEKSGQRGNNVSGFTTDEHSPSKSTLLLPLHPLISDSSRNTSSATRSIIWTEYPEEPHGSVLENLKRSWTPLLPQSTVIALFPNSGIRKQDDAKTGIEVITRALSLDRKNGGTACLEQLDVIMKWIMFTLCSKESTTGLVDILALLKDLLDFLVESKRELSDMEALETVPLLLDKASGAKGRFRDTYLEIAAMLENEVLLTPKRLGMVCVAVIDSSPHAKAKAQACHTCLSCIEKTGLAGFGKKGVVATARMLSQDTTMHRMAALELMESILSKINGDIIRLARICGPSLSDKGQQLLEERWYKNHSKDITHASVSNGSPGTRQNPTSPKFSTFGFQKEEKQSDLVDELPRLSLRTAGKDQTRQSPRKVLSQETSRSEPFSFSFSTGKASSPPQMDSEFAVSSSETAFHSFNSIEVEPSGAAAALRARLLKIREKSMLPEIGTATNTGNFLTNNDQDTGEPIDVDAIIENIEFLLEQSKPIPENDSKMATCIDSLKIIHSAISKQLNASVSQSRIQLDNCRERLLQNVDQTVGLLRRLIFFSINSGSEDTNVGLLLPLLSLCLAILMALFRDEAFALVVSVEELSLLLRETGSALLDSRLSASDELNDDTRSQMVRAINKLAVQAATSSARHTSFQALLNVQQELKECNDSYDDQFRSRLSRVIVKLFARVVKAEESVGDPYVHGRIDMEALICSLEDILACNENSIPSEAKDVSIDMIKSLLQSILNVQGSATSVRGLMEELGIDPIASALGKLLIQCDGDRDEAIVDSESVRQNATNIVPMKMTPSKDVASLVSRLGCAPPGAEREAALASIRAYKLEYGDKELDTHLQQLSGPFRDFIVEQINRDPSPLKKQMTVMTGDNASSTSDSVSDRIRSLRSRLQASESSSPQKASGKVEEAVMQEDKIEQPRMDRDEGLTTTAMPFNLNSAITNPEPSESTFRKNNNNIAVASPSKIPPLTVSATKNDNTTATTIGTKSITPESKIPLPGQRLSRLPGPSSSIPSFSASASSAQSLRERLAARQGISATTPHPPPANDHHNNDDDNNTDMLKSSIPSSTTSSSLGRAAALRARLEVVKQQSSNKQ